MEIPKAVYRTIQSALVRMRDSDKSTALGKKRAAEAIEWFEEQIATGELFLT